MNDFLRTDLIVWCSTFWRNDWDIQVKDYTDGIFLNRVFCEIAEYDWSAVEPLLSNETVYNRLQNWKMLVKNLEEYFLEELHYLVMIAPPSIFHIIFSPLSGSSRAQVERVTLLLLLAAVKCKRREFYIREIMDNLSTETQNGIMQSITSLTEYPDTTISLSGPYELSFDLRSSLRKALNNRMELYFLLTEEVLHRICDSHPDWTSSKSPQSNELNEKENENCNRKVLRSRSLSSSMDLIGVILKRSTEERCETSKSPQSIETDTAATSETGYESRPPTDKTTGERPELGEPRDLDSILEILEGVFLQDSEEKREIVSHIMKAKSKIRHQSLIISEQTYQLEEAQAQLSEARAETDRMRAERARLADAAAAARHWRDEADAGQQALMQLRESERTCEKLKQRLEAALYYRIRCQELSEEVDSLVKTRDNLEIRLSDQQSEQSRIRMLDEKLIEKVQRIEELESQREKDLDEICQLKNELAEVRLEVLNTSRNNLSTRVTSPIQSDCEENDLICRLPSLQSEASNSDLFSAPQSQPHSAHLEEEEARIQKLEKELQRIVDCGASRLEKIRSQLDSICGTRRPNNFGSISSDGNATVGSRVEALMDDLDQAILDILSVIEKNDKKLADLEKLSSSKLETHSTLVQTDLAPLESGKKALEQSNSSSRSSPRVTFEDKAVLATVPLRDNQTDVMPPPAKPSIKAAEKCTQTHAYVKRVINCQTPVESQPRAVVCVETPKTYRICNRFGSPVQTFVMQPAPLKRSVSTTIRPEKVGLKPVCHKAVNTEPIVGQMHNGTSDAVREALLQASEAKTRVVVIQREKDDVDQLLKSTQLELQHAREFLEEYEKRSAYLEKENRTLLLQLRSLLSQNQGVVTEALENKECHYREKLALRDELELIKRHKERLEEKLMDQFKTLSSPKKNKQNVSLLQRARDALIKNKDVYTLDNSLLPQKDTQEPALRPALNDEEVSMADEYLKDFQNFIGNLEKRRFTHSPDINKQKHAETKAGWSCSSKSSISIPNRYFSDNQVVRNGRDITNTDSECTDHSIPSLTLQKSPLCPVTDRSEEDHIEKPNPTSYLLPTMERVINKTSSLTIVPTRNRLNTAEHTTFVDNALKKTQSLSTQRRRVPSGSDNPVQPSLGGLIGRKKVSPVSSSYASPATSFSQSYKGTNGTDGTLTRRPPLLPTSTMSGNPPPSVPERSNQTSDYLAKPVVFLRYGDL